MVPVVGVDAAAAAAAAAMRKHCAPVRISLHNVRAYVAVFTHAI